MYVAGEEWTAVSDEAVERGAEVVVVEVEGLTLKVKKVVK
ncbi:NfeD family protein [Pyrobaculum sp.]